MSVCLSDSSDSSTNTYVLASTLSYSVVYSLDLLVDLVVIFQISPVVSVSGFFRSSVSFVQLTAAP